MEMLALIAVCAAVVAVVVFLLLVLPTERPVKRLAELLWIVFRARR